MIGLFREHDGESFDLVEAAFKRSVPHNLVRRVEIAQAEAVDIAFTTGPTNSLGLALLDWLKCKPRKLIVFGQLPSSFVHAFGLTASKPFSCDRRSFQALTADVGDDSESLAQIEYVSDSLGKVLSDQTRPVDRFDFEDEWNNLAYGSVKVANDIWSIASQVNFLKKDVIASVLVNKKPVVTYASLIKVGSSYLLWYNRAVGPIDSCEWKIVENFICDFAFATHPCCPVISEIPWGYDAAVTMRLDCDEDIASSNVLLSEYKKLDVPFSLAITTKVLHSAKQTDFLCDFARQGGSILSHSVSHAPHWGGDYRSAKQEAEESRRVLSGMIGRNVVFAVSPFHQTPKFALQALSDAGYLGCVGGSAKFNPEFNLARGGNLAGLPAGFVGHSQQCMMHGDCLLRRGDKLSGFKRAFDNAFQSETLFGYLDHPFSERYAYGWKDENQRKIAHREFISHVRQKAERPCFMDEDSALQFLRARSKIEIEISQNKLNLLFKGGSVKFNFGIRFRGQLRSSQYFEELN